VTFSDLKSTVMGIANLTSQEADRRVGQAINQLYKQLTAELGLDPTRFVTRTQAMTLGVATLTLPNIEKIDRVYDTSDNGRRELVPVSITALRRDATGTSQPTRWALQSVTATTVTILTDTVPQTAYTLQADGMATLADLEGEDVPVIAESYHHVLTWAVLSDELLRKEKDKLAGIYKLKSDELLGKLRQHYVDYPALTRQAEAQAPSAGVSGSSGSGTLGGTSYTQTGLVTFDRDPDAPFAVTPGSAVVPNLDADTVDGLHASVFARWDGLGTPLGQIAFPAVANPSTNPNTLDDYEEGTWTPTVTASGGSSGVTYAGQHGYFTKIGRHVTVYFRVALTAAGTLTGNVQIGGLPFPSVNVTNLRVLGSMSWVNTATAYVTVFGTIVENSSVITILASAAAVTSSGGILQANVTNTTVFSGSFSYPAA
jgi:hypothetical protein